jgi:molybdopterin converting factor subunit 1
MKLRALFFGRAHDVVGMPEEEVELIAGQTVGDLWRQYEARFPGIASLKDSLVVAVNREIARRDQGLHDGDEVAFLPPVSGGAMEGLCDIVRKPIRTAELAEALKAPEDGAQVVFEGIVRNHSGGRRTLYLEYEAYEPMAIKKMEEIRREVMEKWPVDHIGIIHRVGRLEIGETSVAIVVTSAHRAAAFEACRHAIDRLKQIVPIWKKEYFEDGAVWADGEGMGGFQEPDTARPTAEKEGASGPPSRERPKAESSCGDGKLS